MKRVIYRIVLSLMLLLPVAAWALYKPVRILVPELVPGVSCPTENICLDDVSRLSEAESLYFQAIEFVNTSVGKLEEQPHAVFCTTENCFQSFGFKRSSAGAIGISGIVISPRGWEGYYLRHELIHHLQAERLGLYRYTQTPDWFKEGMAYSLSQHEKELEEPWQGYRQRFEAWYPTIDRSSLWDEARNL